jgi:hypothetical protein
MEQVQIDPIEFDMFKMDGVDNYLSLQSLMSLQESIQPINVVDGCHKHENNQVYKIS